MSESEGSDAELGALVASTDDGRGKKTKRQRAAAAARRRTQGSLQQLDPYASPITRLLALMLVVLLSLALLVWSGAIGGSGDSDSTSEAELRRQHHLNSQHRPWSGIGDNDNEETPPVVDGTDPEGAIPRTDPKLVVQDPQKQPEPVTPVTIPALPVHRDPWQTCPKSVQLRLDDATAAGAIHAERERQSIHTCPLALFPLPAIVATADIFASGAKELYIPDTADALKVLPELSASSPRPNAFAEGSACRNVCPLSSRMDDRGWRGFDADDAHLPLDSRRIWHLRDYVGTMSFRDQSHWVFGWPFQRPKEDDSISVREMDRVLCCLPLGSLVYVHTFRTEEACRTLLPRLKRPVILLLGGDDPSPMPRCPDAFNNHPMILHSFMQNMAADGVGHPRVNVVPSSINMIIHRFLNIFLMQRFVQEEHAKAARLAASQLTPAQVDALPLCSFLSQSASADFARSLENCGGHTLECSHEKSHLRRLLHLDDYVPDPALMALHIAALKPGFDVASIRAFFTTHRAKYGELYLSAPTSWHDGLKQGEQQLGEDSPHELSLTLPERVASWVAASVMDGSASGEASSLAERQIQAIERSVQSLKSCKLDVSRLDSHAVSAYLSPPASIPAPTPPASTLARFPLFGHWRKLALINFRVENGREALYDHFCSPSGKQTYSSWITCVGMLKDHADLNGNNPHLLTVYALQTEYMYWLSPPGAGLDCHRTWEAMFVGSIPIVPRTSLDALYADGDLPILVVDDLSALTAEFLLAHAPRFAQVRRDFPRRKLLQAYWMHFIAAKRERVVDAYLAAQSASTAYSAPPNQFGEESLNFEREWRRPMNKCWGGNMPPANQQPQC